MARELEMIKKGEHNENGVYSIPSCMAFKKVGDAKEHARSVSQSKTETRHVIHAGDYYFSSTTAQIFWYEKLIISYRNGLVDRSILSQEDLKKLAYETRNED